MRRMLAALLVFLALGLAQKELRLFIWSEYIDPAILEAFTKQTGLKVRVDLYESNEELIAKLQAGGVSQYDVIVPSDFYVPSIIQLKLVQPWTTPRSPTSRTWTTSSKTRPTTPGTATPPPTSGGPLGSSTARTGWASPRAGR
jgi:spermidine/putrescine transport system substrate-binding protein